MIRLAVFDLDGTLIDSKLDLFHAVNHALRTVGLPGRSVEEVAGFVGEGVARLVERSVAPHVDRFDAALAAWWQHYRAHLLDNTVLFPGVETLLRECAVPLAVHTNKPGSLARHILAGLGVLDRFVDVIGGDEAPRKPDPSGTRAILERQGVAAADAVLVGDSLVDLETARAVPLQFIPVAWGLVAPERLFAAGAPRPVRSSAELRAALGCKGEA